MEQYRQNTWEEVHDHNKIHIKETNKRGYLGFSSTVACLPPLLAILVHLLHRR